MIAPWCGEYHWTGQGWTVSLRMVEGSNREVIFIERSLELFMLWPPPLMAPPGTIKLAADENDLHNSIYEFERVLKRGWLSRLLGRPLIRVIYGMSRDGLCMAEIPIADQTEQEKLIQLFRSAIKRLKT